MQSRVEPASITVFSCGLLRVLIPSPLSVKSGQPYSDPFDSSCSRLPFKLNGLAPKRRAQTTPPRFPLRFFVWLCYPRRRHRFGLDELFLKLGANGIVVAQIMYAPTARAIVARKPAGERMCARKEVVQTERLVVAQLHTIIRRHEPANGSTTMTADGVVDSLDRIRSEQASLIQMKIAVAAGQVSARAAPAGGKISLTIS